MCVGGRGGGGGGGEGVCVCMIVLDSIAMGTSCFIFHMTPFIQLDDFCLVYYCRMHTHIYMYMYMIVYTHV